MPLPPPDPARVLVVDDEAMVANLLRRILESDGHEVHVASSSAEAERLAGELQSELVILDVNLPDIDGPELCRRLRADPRTASVGIVMVSGGDEVSTEARVREAGADDFLAKPFHRESVLECIAGVLRSRRRVQ